MRIHSDTITLSDICDAAAHVDDVSGATVQLDPVTFHGSRSRGRAFTVGLSGDGTLSKRRRNAGSAKNADHFSLEYAATYDQWGYFLAYLFAKDPDMVANYYDGADDFHTQTQHKYF